MRIGIPRALYYYYHFPLWQGFFAGLGHEVVVSSSTTKTVLEQGLKYAVDEACLPIKLYYGHVLDLINKADLLFLPRIVSVAEKEFICPKFMGLPDMINHNLSQLPEILMPTIDLSRDPEGMKKVFNEIGQKFTHDQEHITRAWQQALVKQSRFEKLLKLGCHPEEAIQLSLNSTGPRPRPAKPRMKIGLLGHGYNIYDPYISMNLIGRLAEQGVEVITADNLLPQLINTGAAQLPKRMFWTLGKNVLGAAFHFIKRPDIAGIIHVASFGCGPDSMVGSLVEANAAKVKNKPLLMLNIDEHSGEAGLVTRIEAFIDLITRRAG